MLNGLPFHDKGFDVIITSYVAHSFMLGERLILYNEMKRFASHTAILLDYNENRSLIIDITEYLEDRGYFSFI